ncbi:RnfABCDGE type electron transport complex subunit B [Exilibacterium tricleocarpae]|uniref:Ion-translocating oxidoreductase complex subunit B n=2 Tax=Exilibacterium tricleocarpae TaxID=2591008 RepID=A0A545UA34_9GAMM|nr:RnfABCDGE type electron transport complex subunit B [Exilibacterium tricleocarpae]
MTILTAMGVIGVLTFLLASLLLFASRKLHVEEDPRLDVVEAMLPHNNCGACGYPSCRLFAEALVAAAVLPGKCTVSSEAERDKIATFLHVEAGVEVKQVARLACAGGANVATKVAHYRGAATCGAAAQVAGGGKGCWWGCLGLGDCERVCDFDAIVMNDHDLPVVDEDKCTACGDCIEACPKDLFSLQRVDHHLWVPCKNLEEGDWIRGYCEVACTACGRCAVDAPGHLITMQNNLPVIDYTKGRDSVGDRGSRVAIERCPTGAIVWIDDSGEITKGAASKKIVRHSMLPEGPS